MKMILDERGKKYVLKEGQEFQSDLGIVKADVLENASVGDEVKSHLDHSFKIIKPNINDFQQIDFDGDGKISDEELGKLANSEIKISKTKGLMELFSTHPDSLKRVKRLAELEN